MKKVVLLNILLCLLFGNFAFAQLASWEVDGVDVADGTGIDESASPYSFTSPSLATHITDAKLTLSGSVNPSTSSGQYGCKVSTTLTSLSEAITAGHYIQISITVEAGYRINFSNIDMEGQTSGTGWDNAAFMSEINGYSVGNELDQVSLIQDVTGGLDTDASGWGAPFDLSGIGYQGVTGTTTFRIYGWNATSGAGVSYIRSLGGDDFIINGTVDAIPAIWTGNSDSDWDTGTNWDNGFVPINATNVTIPSGAPRYPIISGNATTSSESNNLTIESGASVTIPVAKALTVNGTLTNNAGNTGIVIESGTSGTGSLKGAGAVSATVKRYLTNYGAVSDSKYHFISSPVTTQAIQPNFVDDPTPASDVDFYRYDEPSNDWINTKVLNTGAWNSSFGDDFIVGKGYLVAYPSAVTKEFTGTLNSYSAASPLEITCTNTDGNGWNLIGNPFPSAIDWDLVKADGLSNMDNALYYYDHNAANYNYYIKLDGDEGTSIGTGTKYIPAMQGFMVHATTAGSCSVSLHEGYQTHSDQNFYKNGNTLSNLLSLTMKNGDNIDETFIYFNSNATCGFDGSYDAYKLYSYSVEMPQVYSIAGIDKLAINTSKSVAENTIIKLGYKTQVSGDLVISVDGIESFINSSEIELEDLFLNKKHNFSTDGDYSFSSEIGVFDDRFVIHFAPVGTEEISEMNNISIWSANNTVNIINNNNTKGEVSIVNIVGQEIANYKLSGSSKQQINVMAQTGVYLIVVRTSNGEVTTQKVIIQN